MSADPRPPLLVIAGPTAAGKTALSVWLGQALARHGWSEEIISADSRLLYRGMDIGTAKPSVEERGGLPHHLIDVADPAETWSLTQFQAAAQSVIEEVQQRGGLPVLVGGTGQYVHAIVEGWQPPPPAPDPRLRQALTAWGEQIGARNLHARLTHIDPHAARRMDANNLRRVVRALEVIFSTGQRFSELSRQSETPFRATWIGVHLPRPALYARADARIDAMLAAGWLDEVHRLLKAGADPSWPSMSALGYRELIAHLRGEISLEEAVSQIRAATRRFIRHQANWFKPSDARIAWFAPGDEQAVLAHVLHQLAN